MFCSLPSPLINNNCGVRGRQVVLIGSPAYLPPSHLRSARPLPACTVAITAHWPYPAVRC